MNAVGIRCQNCQSYLEIDSSLMELSLAQKDMLIQSTGDSFTERIGYKIPTDRMARLDHIKRPSELNLPKLGNNGIESYVFLHDSESIPSRSLEYESIDDEDDYATKTLSSHISALLNIFNILSSKNNIDYPICQNCCDLLMNKLRDEYEDAIKERDVYRDFLTRLEREKDVPINSDIIDKEKQVDDEREKLLSELISLEDLGAHLDDEIKDLEYELKKKYQEHQNFLQNQNLKDLAKIKSFKEMRSLKNQYELTLNNLDRLRKINVFNETFCISHNGSFGTINKLRLGSFDQITVSWQEINAALGQLILLLATISSRLKLELDGYKLLPLGSFSKIKKYDVDQKVWITYNAFENGDFKLGSLFFRETSLDKSLECILSIVSQIAFKISIISHDQDEIELPYKMHADKINDISIKLSGKSPTLEWTTACKFLLTNAKWLLAFSSSLMTNNTLTNTNSDNLIQH